MVALGSACFGAGVAVVVIHRHMMEEKKHGWVHRMMLNEKGGRHARTQTILQSMRNCDCFVLDNSLRETTVASIIGHTEEGKFKILEAIRAAGMKHIILGAFGPTRRVDENFIGSMRNRNQFREDEHYWAFSEFMDADAPWFEGARSATAEGAEEGVPYGLKLCKKFGIHNAVIEAAARNPNPNPNPDLNSNTGPNPNP